MTVQKITCWTSSRPGLGLEAVQAHFLRSWMWMCWSWSWGVVLCQDCGFQNVKCSCSRSKKWSYAARLFWPFIAGCSFWGMCHITHLLIKCFHLTLMIFKLMCLLSWSWTWHMALILVCTWYWYLWSWSYVLVLETVVLVLPWPWTTWSW